MQGVGQNPTLSVLHGANGTVSGLAGATNLITTSGFYIPPPPPPPAENTSNANISAAFFASAVNQSLDRNLSNQLSDEVVEVGEVGLLPNGAVKRLDGDATCDKAVAEECVAK
jgi:hypothetical protein